MVVNRKRLENAGDNVAELEQTDAGDAAQKTDSGQKLRRCLLCGEDFPSTWAGERICRRCRSSNTWRQG